MPDQPLNVATAIQRLQANNSDWSALACGVTRRLEPIPALVHKDAYSSATDGVRLLLIGGMSGLRADVDLALRALESSALTSEQVALSAIPCVNIDGLSLGSAPENGAGGNPAFGYPPEDNFFYDPQNPETRYVWRWVCFQGPDLVLELIAGDSASWQANSAASNLANALGASDMPADDSLLSTLGDGTPDELGTIPGLRLTVSSERLETELDRLRGVLGNQASRPVSHAREALEKRRTRSPLEIARTLAYRFGRTLDPVIYTQGVAISGRARLAAIDSDSGELLKEVETLVEPFLSGERDAFGDAPTTPTLAGVVWAEDMAAATGDSRYADLMVKAADIYKTGDDGAPPPSSHNFIPEDFFLNGAVLGRAYKLTGDGRYIDMLTDFLLESRIQQDDGLFWHGRDAPFYWGRGNGFAAMGLAETLTYLPDGHAARDRLIAMCRKQLDGLRRYQEPSGMYRQVIDFPGTYQELTATCMIGYATARGIRLGWLDNSYRDTLNLAWRGVSERVDDDGNVVDGCTGTGVQKSLSDYIYRPALSGHDDRTGSMALWFAVEMMQLTVA